jgi:hypothetical protein
MMRVCSLLAFVLFPTASFAFVRQQRLHSSRYRHSETFLAAKQSSDNDKEDEEQDPAFKYYNKQDDDDDDEIVTQEMLWRDLLEDPKVKKKNKKGSYKTLDNRDSLPFVVKLVTPDPYTPVSEKKKLARSNTEQERKKKKAAKKTNLMGGIAASIYAQDEDGSLQRILGEFSLDKHTNCGDLLEVGNKEYEVQKARCQYKYAGGKRFVMVRKILEVKEVLRQAEESYLTRQLHKSDTLIDEPPQLE